MEIELPNGRVTSRLGLGMASLMREGSYKKRSYVFDAAYDAGYRHFDVAPLYGLGKAEQDLGRHLRGKDGSATVATKFGLRPSSLAQAIGRVQGPLRYLISRSTLLRRAARGYSGSSSPVVLPTPDALQSSIEKSLAEIQTEQLDILLLHDAPWSRAWDALWNSMLELPAANRVGCFGLTGDNDILSQYPQDFLANLPILQVPSPARYDDVVHGGDIAVYYGAVSTHLSVLIDIFDKDVSVRRQLQDLVGGDLRTPSQVAALLVSRLLAKNERSMVLVGSCNSNHVAELWTAVEKMLPQVSANRSILASLIFSLLASEPGIGW